jgi:hypothetical protein
MCQHQVKCGASLLFYLTLPPALLPDLPNPANVANWCSILGSHQKQTPSDTTGKTMTTLSLNKAVSIAKKTKKTIQKDLESGKLSGSKNERGHWVIDQAELFRVYDLKLETPVSHQKQTPIDTTQDTTENLIKIAQLEAELKAEKRIADELREDRDEWRKQAQQLLLSPPQEHQTPPESQNKPRGLLSRIFG